jgi:tRNA(fMet)-specific endonuclease VapC
VNKALLDTDIYSEILKAVNPTVAQNATAFRQTHGILTVSVLTMVESRASVTACCPGP